MRKLLLLLSLLCASILPAAAQLSSTGNITALGATCFTTNACIVLPLVNSANVSTGPVSITLAGTFNATVQFEGSADNGATWTAIPGIPSTGGSPAVTSSTTTGTWGFILPAFTGVRARASAFTSGTVAVFIQASTGNNLQSIAAGAVNTLFGSSIVEATLQSGADINAQIANACGALSAAGSGGGGIMTLTWNGNKTGTTSALGGPLATCPFGTNIYFTGTNGQQWTTDVPIVLYGGHHLYGQNRGTTTIKASATFKTAANARNWATAIGGVTAAGSTITFVCTATCAAPPITLSQAQIDTPIAGQTTFTAASGAAGLAGGSIVVTGFAASGGANNGTYTVISSTATTIVVTSSGNVNEVHAGTATQNTPIPIGSPYPTNIGTLDPGEPIEVGCNNAGDLAFNGYYPVNSIVNSTTFTLTIPRANGHAASAGTCVLIAGIPLIDMGPKTFGGFAATFAETVTGFTLDCDDTGTNKGCSPLRNKYSQEHTYVSQSNLINYNFIGLWLDNGNSSGLQNSGPYEDLEIYGNPTGTGTHQNCNATGVTAAEGYPFLPIYVNGLSTRGLNRLTATTTACAGSNWAMYAMDSSSSGAFLSEVFHCEGFNVCIEVGQSAISNGGTTIMNVGGQPTQSDGRTSDTTPYPAAIEIGGFHVSSNNFASTDVAILTTRKNTAANSAILNNLCNPVDTLNGASDTVVASYIFDKAGSIGCTTLTTSQTVPTKTVGLAVNRIQALNNGVPTCTFLTGGGTSPSCTAQAGSGDSLGTILAVTGTGAPGNTGTVRLTFTSAMGTHVSSCVFSGNLAGAGQWNTRASFMASTQSATAPVVTWDNNAVNLGTSTEFRIDYFCAGK